MSMNRGVHLVRLAGIRRVDVRAAAQATGFRCPMKIDYAALHSNSKKPA
ncbi:MAG TPA: hypothetical protein VFW68_00275 [Rhodocyclaceae bacterium]|nr:hypothetical protein [Rhodocyclaceae bacterium]